MVSLASSPARKVLLLLLCGCSSAQVLHESTTTNAAATAQSAQPAAAERSATAASEPAAATVAAAAQPAAAEPTATVASTVTAASEPAAATEPAATVAAGAQPAAAERHHQWEHASRMGRWRRWRRKPAVRGALLVSAGGLSAAIAKSATAPLERVKLLAQAGEPGNFMQLLAEVVRAEGLQGLWRGNPANIVRVIPNKGVLLMCSDMYKDTVRTLLPGCAQSIVSSVAAALSQKAPGRLLGPMPQARPRARLQEARGAAPAGWSDRIATQPRRWRAGWRG